MAELTRDKLVDFVRAELGYPVVEVELEEPHYDHAINQALRMYNRYMGEMQVLAYYNQVNNVSIDLSSHTGLRGIVGVMAVFPEQNRSYAQLNVFELLYRMVYPMLPVGEWYMLRSFYEMYQRVRGTEMDWYYNEWDQTLQVDCHGGPWDLNVEIVKNVDLTSLETGRAAYVKDFYELTLAYCKRMLANIRGKFGGTVPAPGGALATDAQKLDQEAKETIAKIEDVLMREAAYEYAITWGG